jgi:hypothetical protein
MELGTYDELEECEQLVADFVGKEAAMVIGAWSMTGILTVRFVGDTFRPAQPAVCGQ